MDASRFGKFIAQKRKALGLTQEKLGEIVFVSGKAVSKWERGLSFPDINTLKPLADALGVSLAELMQAGGGPAGSDTEEGHMSVSDAMDMANRQLGYYKRSLRRTVLISAAAVLLVCVFTSFVLIITQGFHKSDPVWDMMHRMLDWENTVDYAVEIYLSPEGIPEADGAPTIVNTYDIHIDKRKKTVRIITGTAGTGGTRYAGERSFYDISINENFLVIKKTSPDGTALSWEKECDTASFEKLIFEGTYYSLTSQKDPGSRVIDGGSPGVYSQERTLSEKALELIRAVTGDDSIRNIQLSIRADPDRKEGYYIWIHIGDCTQLYTKIQDLIAQAFPGDGCAAADTGSPVSCDIYVR